MGLFRPFGQALAARQSIVRVWHLPRPPRLLATRTKTCPRGPDSHRRSTRSPLSAGGSFLVSLRCVRMVPELFQIVALLAVEEGFEFRRAELNLSC